MQTIRVERAEGVVTVTLDRPRTKNALTRSMVAALPGILTEIDRRADDRVLVLTGAGGAFCSGADLTEDRDPHDREALLGWVRSVGDVAVTLHRLSKPTVAMVAGDAVGAGCSLALGCDLVVAARSARFSMIFTRRALSLDAGASWLLPRLVGMARAKEIAFLADLYDASSAAALGLVTRVVPDERLGAEVRELAGALARGPAAALARTKALLADAWGTTLEEAVEHEAQAQVENLGGPDVAEAMAAFRRRPRSS